MHDLHVWSLSIGKPALSVHLQSKKPETLLQATKLIKNKYQIFHSTIQIENQEDQAIKCANALH